MKSILVALVLLLSLSLYAQTSGDKPAPKNLQVLPAGVDLHAVMSGFTAGLGVKCFYCHVQGNFAGDDNPNKNVARTMIKIVRSVNAMLPAGTSPVSCYTCHRGQEKPVSAP